MRSLILALLLVGDHLVGGARNYELEADRLSAHMALRAGLDPVLGVAYLMRIPDRLNKFPGTHPRNADRIAGVRAAVFQ